MEDIHYYPFGGRHKGYLGLALTPGIDETERVSLRAVPTPSQSSGSDNYHYKYNQKELQIESGFYDYGWRQYMPDIGRWNGIDQLAESYHSINPYAYVSNNPISFTDPDGRKITPTGDGYSFSGADLDVLKAILSMGGSISDLSRQLSSYESNGGDFGSGPLSDFWDSYDSGGLFIGVNSSTSYISWTKTEVNDTASEDVVALDGPHLISKKISSDSFKYVFEKEGNSLLDGFQIGLDIVGLVPGFGEVADGANGLIYLYRGDYLNASLSFGAMIPFAGWAATGGKFINKASKSGTIIKQTSKKADYLFTNKNDAMNWARKQLGHNTNKMYDANGKWIGWNNSKGSVYWGHGDWGKGVGSSTFPHLNYNIEGTKGHLFLQDKIINRGMGEDFVNHFNF